MLTLAGPGGAGKTRLGLQVAADLVDSFGDGVWFVDLAADAEPDDAFETVIRALSLAVSRTGSPLDVLKNRLRDKEMLLVLDNFEQVVAAASGLAELLQSAPRLTVIVTSRETLRVRGEQVYAVPPLSLPDPAASLAEIADSEAVRLFVERAMATSPTFDLTADNAEAVARICMRLDGLPLAIELAAARLNLFTPADLLHRITDRLDVLASGGRDVPERQRTLWGAIGWSYELLTDEERALFDAFAVFTGADLPAVEAVAADLGGAGFTLDTLSSLVDKSLVTRRDVDGSLRFGMLQMIKEFAADRLAADEDRQVVANEAHAVYYAGFAAGQLPRLESRDRQAALALLGADLDNLRTAWSYWVAQSDRVHVGEMVDPLWALHTSRGWYHGAIEMAGDMLDVIAADREPNDDAAELRLRTRLGRALMAVHGYNLEVEQNFSRALELTESVGTVQDRVPVLRALASYYLQSANIPTALKLGHQLFGIGEELGDEAVELEARGVIASSLLFMDVDTTLEHLEHVINGYDPAKHRIGYQLGPNLGVVARIAAGIMLWAVGKLDSAVQRINDAVEFAAAIDSPYSLTWATYHEGYFAVSRGRFDEVLNASRRLAAVAEEHNYALWQALASVLEGVAITAMGDPETGVSLTEQSVTIYQGLAPPPIFWPLVLGLRASVHAMAGEMQEALDIVDEAVAIMGDIAPPELFVNRGDLLQATLGPEHPEVLETYQRGLAQAQGFRLRLPELQAHTRLVRLRRALGHEDDGASELAALLETFKEGAGEADVMAARAVLEDAPS